MTRQSSRIDILRARADAFTEAVPRVKRGHPRAVHRMRVAVRRLRELLPVLAVDREHRTRVARSLRRAARRLGPLRELDVLAALLAGQRTSLPDADADTIDLVAGALAVARRAERRRVVDRDFRERLDRAVKRLRKLQRHIDREDRESPGGRRRWTSVLEARIVRRATEAGRAIDAAGTLYVPERLHEARIALKKLRYALELMSDATGASPRGDLKTLELGQQLLGGMRDTQALADYVRGHGHLAVPRVATWRAHESLGAALDVRCRHLHAQYVRAQPAILAVCAHCRAGASRPAAPVAPTRRAG